MKTKKKIKAMQKQLGVVQEEVFEIWRWIQAQNHDAPTLTVPSGCRCIGTNGYHVLGHPECPLNHEMAAAALAAEAEVKPS